MLSRVAFKGVVQASFGRVEQERLRIRAFTRLLVLGQAGRRLQPGRKFAGQKFRSYNIHGDNQIKCPYKCNDTS